jgi:hypothetical protein
MPEEVRAAIGAAVRRYAGTIGLAHNSAAYQRVRRQEWLAQLDEDELAAHRARNAERQRAQREQLDEDELAAHRARDAERQRAQREHMSEQELTAYNAREAQRLRAQRERMSEELAAKRARNAESQRKSRENKRPSRAYRHSQTRALLQEDGVGTDAWPF